MGSGTLRGTSQATSSRTILALGEPGLSAACLAGSTPAPGSSGELSISSAAGVGVFLLPSRLRDDAPIIKPPEGVGLDADGPMVVLPRRCETLVCVCVMCHSGARFISPSRVMERCRLCLDSTRSFLEVDGLNVPFTLQCHMFRAGGVVGCDRCILGK